MPRDKQPGGECPKCQQAEVTCSYNHFEREELVIDAWEHKCSNCGWRDTTGYRTDEPDSLPESGAVNECPYCGRQGQA